MEFLGLWAHGRRRPTENLTLDEQQNCHHHRWSDRSLFERQHKAVTKPSTCLEGLGDVFMIRDDRWPPFTTDLIILLVLGFTSSPASCGVATDKNDQMMSCLEHYWSDSAMTMTMTMTHSEKSRIHQMKAWPYRQECRDHDPTKKNLFYW